MVAAIHVAGSAVTGILMVVAMVALTLAAAKREER